MSCGTYLERWWVYPLDQTLGGLYFFENSGVCQPRKGAATGAKRRAVLGAKMFKGPFLEWVPGHWSSFFWVVFGMGQVGTWALRPCFLGDNQKNSRRETHPFRSNRDFSGVSFIKPTVCSCSLQRQVCCGEALPSDGDGRSVRRQSNPETASRRGSDSRVTARSGHLRFVPLVSSHRPTGASFRRPRWNRPRPAIVSLAQTPLGLRPSPSLFFGRAWGLTLTDLRSH